MQDTIASLLISYFILSEDKDHCHNCAYREFFRYNYESQPLDHYCERFHGHD